MHLLTSLKVVKMLKRGLLDNKVVTKREDSTTTVDPSGTYLNVSSERIEGTGSSSAVLVLRSQSSVHTLAPRLQMEDKNTCNSRPSWVGRPINRGAVRYFTLHAGSN